MSQVINTLLETMWQDYLLLCPDAKDIYELFSKQNNGVVINDHIALRTYNLPKVNIATIAQPFLDQGYVEGGQYEFPNRKLVAKHFQSPDEHLPKVFISELLVEELSDSAGSHIHNLVDQVSAEQVVDPMFSASGRPWQVDTTVYDALLKESEYASWVAAFGYRANHFTVSINHLKAFDQIEELNSLLQSKGYILNEEGGLVKGSPEVLLEQSSTMAGKVEVAFSDAKRTLPGCFYEFAKRYKTVKGELYQGFVAASADKIFTSTNAKSQ